MSCLCAYSRRSAVHSPARVPLQVLRVLRSPSWRKDTQPSRKFERFRTKYFEWVLGSRMWTRKLEVFLGVLAAEVHRDSGLDIPLDTESDVMRFCSVAQAALQVTLSHRRRTGVPV